jgi:hypothetical protein
MVLMTETKRPPRLRIKEMEVSVESIDAAVSGKRFGNKIDGWFFPQKAG